MVCTESFMPSKQHARRRKSLGKKDGRDVKGDSRYQDWLDFVTTMSQQKNSSPHSPSASPSPSPSASPSPSPSLSPPRPPLSAASTKYLAEFCQLRVSSEAHHRSKSEQLAIFRELLEYVVFELTDPQKENARALHQDPLKGDLHLIVSGLNVVIDTVLNTLHAIICKFSLSAHMILPPLLKQVLPYGFWYYEAPDDKFHKPKPLNFDRDLGNCDLHRAMGVEMILPGSKGQLVAVIPPKFKYSAQIVLRLFQLLQKSATKFVDGVLPGIDDAQGAFFKCCEFLVHSLLRKSLVNPAIDIMRSKTGRAMLGI